MVNLKSTRTVLIPPENLSSAFGDTMFIAELAQQLFRDHIECGLDLSIEDEALNSFDDVVQCIDVSKDSVIEYIDDIIDDFRGMLVERVRNVGATIQTVTFDGSGKCINADVLVIEREGEQR